jgi:hypothetical protein
MVMTMNSTSKETSLSLLDDDNNDNDKPTIDHHRLGIDIKKKTIYYYYYSLI